MFCVTTDIPESYPVFFFFFNDTATTEIYTLSLHDALPICNVCTGNTDWAIAITSTVPPPDGSETVSPIRSEEHTSELQSRRDLVCRLLLEKKKKKKNKKKKTKKKKNKQNQKK